MVEIVEVVLLLQIRTGFRMLRHNQGLSGIGISAEVMGVNIRVAVVVVVHIITPVVVDTVVRVLL
jgi:hypothetical protein